MDLQLDLEEDKGSGSGGGGGGGGNPVSLLGFAVGEEDLGLGGGFGTLGDLVLAATDVPNNSVLEIEFSHCNPSSVPV